MVLLFCERSGTGKSAHYEVVYVNTDLRHSKWPRCVFMASPESWERTWAERSWASPWRGTSFEIADDWLKIRTSLFVDRRVDRPIKLKFNARTFASEDRTCLPA